MAGTLGAQHGEQGRVRYLVFEPRAKSQDPLAWHGNTLYLPFECMLGDVNIIGKISYVPILSHIIPLSHIMSPFIDS